MTFTLTITRGLPGSGKTTWAKAESLRTGAMLLDRDSIRRMLMVAWPHGDRPAEKIVTTIQLDALRTILRNGQSVIVHDTSLPETVVNRLSTLGKNYGAEVFIHDLRYVPLETCIKQDAGRPEELRVGEEVIIRMWTKYIKEKSPKVFDTPIYMMGTTAHGGTANISREEPSLVRVWEEWPDHYVGEWVTGFGYINIVFPKSTTRELTEEERGYYDGRIVDTAGFPSVIRIQPLSKENQQ